MNQNKKLMGQIKDEGEEYLKALGGIELHGERLPIWTLGGRRWRGRRAAAAAAPVWVRKNGMGLGRTGAALVLDLKCIATRWRCTTQCGTTRQDAALAGPGPTTSHAGRCAAPGVTAPLFRVRRQLVWRCKKG